MKIAVGFVVLAALPSMSSADTWPQFRGPNRDALSRETGLLKAWHKEGPRLLWRVDNLGYGYGSVTVSNGRAYMVGSRGTDTEFAFALDAKDGRPIWSTTLGKVGNPDQMPLYPGARSTPTLVGKLLYALGSDGDLVCMEAASGKPKWRKSLRADFGGKPGVWAYAESPLIDGKNVIIAPGGEAATVVCLDRMTGKTVWKSALGDLAGYSSAVVARIGGVRQVVHYLSKGMVGLDVENGRLLWRFDRAIDTRFGVHAATPVIQGDYVYAASASGGGLAKIKNASGSFTAELAYMERKAPMALGGSVRVGDYLYGATTTALLCTEFATGKIQWEDRCVGAASVTYADGRLYVHGENGEVALVEATPAAYREAGRFSPPAPPSRGTAKAWNYSVISDGRLFVRDLGSLYVYDIRVKTTQ